MNCTLISKEKNNNIEYVFLRTKGFIISFFTLFMFLMTSISFAENSVDCNKICAEDLIKKEIFFCDIKGIDSRYGSKNETLVMCEVTKDLYEDVTKIGMIEIINKAYQKGDTFSIIIRDGKIDLKTNYKPKSCITEDLSIELKDPRFEGIFKSLDWEINNFRYQASIIKTKVLEVQDRIYQEKYLNSKEKERDVIMLSSLKKTYLDLIERIKKRENGLKAIIDFKKKQESIDRKDNVKKVEPERGTVME